MPISDNNPERRNLTVLSLSIIVYYIAGGEPISDDSIKLVLVNIKFTNNAVLTYIIWVMFLWFWLRHWLANKYSHSAAFMNEKPETNMNYKIVDDCFREQGQPLKPNQLTACYVWHINTKKGWVIDAHAISNHPNMRAELKGYQGFVKKYIFMAKMFFKHKVVSDYYVPYFLGCIAVISGLYKHYPINLGWLIPLFFVLLIEIIWVTRSNDNI